MKSQIALFVYCLTIAQSMYTASEHTQVALLEPTPVAATDKKREERDAKLQELLRAGMNDNLDEVDKFIAQNPDFIPTMTDGSLFSPKEPWSRNFSVFDLIQTNRVDAIRRLLEAGMPVYGKRHKPAYAFQENRSKYPLLPLACSIDMARLIMEYGEKNINTSEASQITILQKNIYNIIENKNTNFLNWLLEHGANPNMGPRHRNAFNIAIQNFRLPESPTEPLTAYFNFLKLFLAYGIDTTLIIYQCINGGESVACWDAIGNRVQNFYDEAGITLRDSTGQLDAKRAESYKYLLDLLSLYDAIDFVDDVSSFPTIMPSFIIHENVTAENTDEPENYATQTYQQRRMEAERCTTEIEQYLHRSLQDTYVLFQKGNPAPLMEFLWHEVGQGNHSTILHFKGEDFDQKRALFDRLNNYLREMLAIVGPSRRHGLENQILEINYRRAVASEEQAEFKSLQNNYKKIKN